jgi:hypothetical protein
LSAGRLETPSKRDKLRAERDKLQRQARAASDALAAAVSTRAAALAMHSTEIARAQATARSSQREAAMLALENGVKHRMQSCKPRPMPT